MDEAPPARRTASWRLPFTMAPSKPNAPMKLLLPAPLAPTSTFRGRSSRSQLAIDLYPSISIRFSRRGMTESYCSAQSRCISFRGRLLDDEGGDLVGGVELAEDLERARLAGAELDLEGLPRVDGVVDAVPLNGEPVCGGRGVPDVESHIVVFVDG